MFYTYLWLRKDGTPYYAGKGKDRRGFKSDGHKVYRPKEKTHILVQEFPSEADAFAAEIFLISYYGRLDKGTGCLRNRTDGGDGTSGWVMPSTTKAKIRARALGRKQSEDACAKMRGIRGPRRKEDIRYGSDNGKAILTEDSVKQIRALYASGGCTYLELANRFEVSWSCIKDVLNNRTWIMEAL